MRNMVQGQPQEKPQNPVFKKKLKKKGWSHGSRERDFA
jgi:hypothetical protein